MSFFGLDFGSLLGVGQAGASFYQGVNANRLQKHALADEEAQVNKADSEAAKRERENAANLKRLRQKAPDLSALLALGKKPLTPATMLTGPGGVDTGKITLGGPPTLLGSPP